MALNHENGDSRGLARAFTGDTAGTIADFEYAVDWGQTTGYDQDFVNEGQAWITALETGENPFDEALLSALQNQ